MDADVIVVGAGLAGLAATAELADAGKKVLLLDQEPEQSLGGQAFWSLGGLFLVDTPEQRRMGVKDSYELALQDWMGSAQFDRESDYWPRRWAEAYVAFAAGEKRQWLHDQGLRVFPVVGWAERGDGRAGGHGNSVPRFHLTWGTGPGVVAPFERRVREGGRQGPGHLQVPAPRRRPGQGRRHRDRRTRQALLAPDDMVRGAESNRDEAGDFEYAAQAVIVTSGGIGANLDLVRQNWPVDRLGNPPKFMVSGVPAHVDGRMHPDHPGRRRRGDQPRPDVALHRGHPQLGPDLEEPRHPHPPRPVVAVALRDRRAVPGAVPPRLRLPRHARRDHAHRLRLLVVRADPEGDREGVRALRLRAEPRPDRQGHQAAALAGARRARPVRSRRSSSTARTSSWPTTSPTWSPG